MEYATPIWDPYLHKDIDALEKVQRKATLWVKSQYSYNVSITSLQTELKWVPLVDRRCITKLCLLYKIQTSAVNLNFKRYFNIDYPTRTTRTGSWVNPDGQLVNHKLHRPPTNKTPLQKSAIVSLNHNSYPRSVTKPVAICRSCARQ